MFAGPNSAVGRENYHAEVIRRYERDTRWGRESLITRLEGKIKESQLLLAAIRRWERDRGAV